MLFDIPNKQYDICFQTIDSPNETVDLPILAGECPDGAQPPRGIISKCRLYSLPVASCRKDDQAILLDNVELPG